MGIVKEYRAFESDHWLPSVVYEAPVVTSVHPAVREATDATYCLGGPRNAPRIVARQYLKPGATQEVAVRLEAEALRLRALRCNQTAQLAPTAVSTDTMDLLP
jgi:hypothetical protein